MSREVIGSGGADRHGLSPDVEVLELTGPPTAPAVRPDAARRRVRLVATGLALLAVAAAGVLQVRAQQVRDVAAHRVAVRLQEARPVGELRTFTDPTGPHAFMTVAFAVRSEGAQPLHVVEARLVGPARTVPMRYPTTLAPGQVSDLEAVNLDPCPAPLGLTGVRLTVRAADGRTETLLLPVPQSLDGLSASCPQPGALPLRAGQPRVRATADGRVVATVAVIDTGSRPVRVTGADLMAGSAAVGARIEPAAPFEVPARTSAGPGTTEVTVTVPAAPCAPGMFSSWNDASAPAALLLPYDDPEGSGTEGNPSPTLVVDLGEQWKAARRAVRNHGCDG
ncbi:MAG TPA: hypothetical protein VFS29_08855 [Motilibacteraceae bacterium]|nr:hypothetical protein [Motilibacteraceae bacterium]